MYLIYNQIQNYLDDVEYSKYVDDEENEDALETIEEPQEKEPTISLDSESPPSKKRKLDT